MDLIAMRVALFLARSFISWLGAWPASAKTRARPPQGLDCGGVARRAFNISFVCASYCSRQKNRHRSGSCKTIHRGKKPSAVHASTLADGVRPRRIVCRRGRKRETRKKAKEKALSALARAGKIAFIRAPVPFTYLGLEHLLDCGIRLLGTQRRYNMPRLIITARGRAKCDEARSGAQVLLLFIVNERALAKNAKLSTQLLQSSLAIKKRRFLRPGPQFAHRFSLSLYFGGVVGARTACCSVFQLSLRCWLGRVRRRRARP
jgi:hypothetical protein